MASVFAWLSATWGWYWETFSWAGIAFAFLVALFILSLSFYLFSLATRDWRTETKAAPVDVEDSTDYADDPEAEADDKHAYNDILAFSLDYLIPACQAQIELQGAAIQQLCKTAKVANLALNGLYHDHNHKTADFWKNYEKLASGLVESPGPIIRFAPMIDCIDALEKNSYKNFCAQYFEIVGENYRPPKTVASLLVAWQERQNALVDAYDQIKRDARFGKLLRPARASRWG